jgi:uncharacterized sulfatase
MTKKWLGRAMAAWLVAALWAIPAFGSGDYGLEPNEVAPGVYVFWGANEPQTPSNGARIANDGFIVGDDAVLVVDTGSTRRYGDQMLAAIATVTDKPVRHVVVSHHHFDHAFGITAFTERDIDVVMHVEAARLLAAEGEEILGLVSDLLGPDWTDGTTIGMPSRTITEPENIDLGGRTVAVTPFGGGHTPGDMAITDRATRTVFAGDLGRPSTVPHADIPTWQIQLDTLAEWDWKNLIPGHGALVTAPAALRAAQDYLAFLFTHTVCAFQQGDSPVEALQVDIPEQHQTLAMLDTEFQRAVFQLFRKYEAEGAPPCDR